MFGTKLIAVMAAVLFTDNEFVFAAGRTMA
jgi:hypothetical protein